MPLSVGRPPSSGKINRISETEQHGHALAWTAVLALLILARIPYFLTHHIQEDAFITFRSAFHLADYGSYAFNVGEHVTGITSVVYGLIVALLRLIFRGSAIPAIQVFNTTAFVTGALLLGKTLFRDFRQQALFCALTSLLPVGLFISFSGMEIALQVLAFCWGLYLLRDGQPRWQVLAAVFLLPLIRPDAIALALLLSLLVFTLNWVRGAAACAASLAGSCGLLIFNKITEGEFIPITMRAKEITYHPSHSLAAMAVRLKAVFITRSFLSPIESRFFIWAGILSLPLFLLCALVAIRRQQTTPLRGVMLAMLGAGILIPLCYVVGGVIFPWYLWTSAWLLAAFPCYLLVAWIAFLGPAASRAVLTGTAVLISILMALQWLVSFNTGKEEFAYRASIGRDIAAMARPQDTLFLEPAGYIPFFAGIHTDDEVGLVSEKVIRYRLRDGSGWYMDFLRTEQPTFLVERGQILEHETPEDASISASDWEWFSGHYQMVRTYHYRVSDYVRNPVLRRLMRAAYTSDYYLFKRVR